MAYSQIVCLALVAVFCVFSANAQQSTGPQPCQNVQGMTGVNATQVSDIVNSKIRHNFELRT